MYVTLSTQDYPMVSKFRWHAVRGKDKKSFYAVANVRKPNGSWTCVLMHQVLRGTGIDHVDRDGLNNQDYNLRPASGSENCANRGMMKNNKSGYRGVWWNKRSNKWVAGVRVNRKMKHLGYFPILEDAVFAVSVAREHYFGKFAPSY
jgi:hypothetical protein